jgi:glycogen debranching enzyme
MADPELLFVSQRRPSAEQRAAWSWLRKITPAKRVSPEAIASELRQAGLLWWHAADAPDDLPAGTLAAVAGWLQAGGRLWLTLRAAGLVRQLGLEDRAPDSAGAVPWSHPDTELPALEGERRGLAGFGPHPLFDGLHGGVFLLRPQPGKPYPEAAYRGPTRGRMAAAEWQYLGMDASRRLALEYRPGGGRVLAVGAHLLFGERPNPYRAFLERFARNCLAYLASPDPAGDDCFWPAVDLPGPALELGDIRPPAGESHALHGGPEALVSDGRGDAQFDVTGRRIVALGRQRSGVTEIWSLPVRLARNVAATFDGVPEPAALAEVRVLPSHVERLFALAPATVVQTVRARAAGDASLEAAHDGRQVMLDYRVTSGRLAQLELCFEVDLRWFWPYPAGVLGQPTVQSAGGELQLLDGQGRARGAVSLEPAPATLTLTDAQGSVHVRAAFAAPARVTASFRGSAPPATGGEDEPLLRVETPDPQFDEQLSWAINGLRAFDVESPVGRGLIAGLAETGTGWWSGRLGYAWYFGRDMLWSSMGCLGAGLWTAVRESLRLLARHQQLDGKIVHELTPAGIAHFDAADSSPLFLVGLERCLRWTGDLELLRELWPAAVRAYDFARRTDRDGDGLIENTGVGHGWSEGGRVYGAHATFYLNACWAVALESMAFLAGLMSEPRLAQRCRRQARRVRATLDSRFYLPEDGWFAYGIAADGTLNTARTMEPAVAALFGLLEPGRAGRFFDALASDRFTTAWGVRYVARDDPLYHPRGYHQGSVWPLFTGWAATAEYAYGRPAAALEHIRSSLALVHQRSLGAIDEVLNGDENTAEGVCPRQLWSHAMTVMPVVQGLLGIQPNAVENRLTLRPQLPPDWAFVRVHALRVGRRRLSLTYRRAAAGVALDMQGGEGLAVDFAPAIPLS